MHHRIVLTHPTGNTFVRAAARALHARGWLHGFYTTVVAPDGAAARLLPAAARRQLARRKFTDIPRDLVHAHPWCEAARLGSAKLGAPALVSVDTVYRDLDDHVARELASMAGVTGVYAYEDGAEQSFRAARNRGMECVYELPIAHWETTQRLLREEAERLPAWRDTLTGLNDSAVKLERKARELELADTVIVPSAFVFDSLPAQIRRSKRCVVAPFGAPRVADDAPARPRGERLRVLFAGAMTQRKGLADLFAAMTLLGRADVELVVMGSPVAPMPFYRQQYADFVYEAPRPHAEVLALMQTCDVLVLPAIVEGRALVQLEALANGLPLIVTRNAGGEDLVEEGRTGFVVPVRAPEALAARLAWFADHKPMLADMRADARRKATEFPWANYETAICDAVSAAEAARC